MPSLVIELSFVGTNFHGWQFQPGLRTIQGELERALKTVTNKELRVVGCCRTDAGVHARQYLASCNLDHPLDLERLKRALNGVLPKDIRVLSLELKERFNARFDTISKLYSYCILTAPDPFLAPYCLLINRPIDIDLLSRSWGSYIGLHDFRSFCKIEPGKSTLIFIDQAITIASGKAIFLKIRASHFLRYMVRRLVGCSIALSQNRLSIDNFKSALTGEKVCPFCAPPHGLTLEQVIPRTKPPLIKGFPNDDKVSNI
ncbi:MAG: tRNA pseudouridine(38-40) synthase TruA [Aquificaceae bacterium]|nr:tRNA pseudouridine(38-40) synthase TruA [Aquificaceae bacterium]MDW8236836.1 tRNA pseudouridine(38-40) synthase TruA [Aquificaceae bacterium]